MPGQQADRQAERLATRGLLRLADLGTAFRQTEAAPGAQPPSPEDCAARPGGPLSKLRSGAAHAGATFKHKKAEAYVYSFTEVFPTDGDAADYIKIRNTPRYRRCRARQFEESVQKTETQGPRWTVEASSLGTKPGDHSAAFAQYDVLFKGKPTASRYLRYSHRNGSVVITLAWDSNRAAKDPRNLDVMISRALDRATTAAFERTSQRG